MMALSPISVRRIDSGAEGISVDRNTPLGNPYVISSESERKASIEKFRSYLWNCINQATQNPNAIALLEPWSSPSPPPRSVGRVVRELLNIVEVFEAEKELTLLCHCHPEKCHAEVIRSAVFWLTGDHQGIEVREKLDRATTQMPAPKKYLEPVFQGFKIVDRLDSNWLDRVDELLTPDRFEPETYAGKLTSCQQFWWGKGVELRGPTSWMVLDAPPIEKNPILSELRSQYYPEANSVLIYYYPPGASISPHQDKEVFDPVVLGINLLQSPLDLFGERDGSSVFVWGGNRYTLKDGDVFKFNARSTHSVPPVKSHRFSLQLRVVRSD